MQYCARSATGVSGRARYHADKRVLSLDGIQVVIFMISRFYDSDGIMSTPS